VCFIVVTTANHFLADAFLGALTALAAAYTARRWPARIPPGAGRAAGAARP